jgi:hypothetical protein
MEVYRSVASHMRQPSAMLFTMAARVDDYALMRYGLASCLMDDGFFCFTDDNKPFASNPWFDEYGVKLGRAVSEPPLEPWRNGVYRRDFENGVVLVNPRGNGAQTVELEPGLTRFKGRQDPVHNNGKPVRTLRLADRAGILLVRERRGRRLAPPRR